jgi:CheY-like chemotaxis protein
MIRVADHAALSPWHVALAELVAGVASASVVVHLPPWLAGALAAFVVGVLLRLLEPWLRLRGERIALAAPASSVAPLTRAVLLVDNDRHLSALMALALRADGHAVHEAHSAADALAAWSRHRPRVVVADLMLPDELGDAFLARLPRGVRAVLTSGVAEAHTLDAAAARCGAISIRKPAHDLVATVRGLLDG